MSDPRLHKPVVVGSSPTAASEEKNESVDPSQYGDGVHVCHTEASVYHGWPEPSASHLKALASSPIEYYERFVEKTSLFEESAAMAYGTLLHLWAEVGEESFWPRVVEPDTKYVTATGALNAAGREWAKDQDEGAIVISPADRKKLWAQTRQILANSASAELLDSAVDMEFNVRWSMFGYRARCRCDGATPSVWYDLKTTREKYPLATFHRAVKDFHYDIQAAVYLSAALAIGYEPHSMRFICTSTTYPYVCEVVWLPESVVAKATEQCKVLLEELAARKETNHWLPATYGVAHELWVPQSMRGEENWNVD